MLTSHHVDVKIGRSAGKHVECTTLINDNNKTEALIVFKRNPRRTVNTTFYIGVHELAHLRIPTAIGTDLNELIAESVAYLVCAAYKLDVAIASMQYLHKLLKSLEGTPELIDCARVISKRLCNEIVTELNGAMHQWETRHS